MLSAPLPARLLGVDLSVLGSDQSRGLSSIFFRRQSQVAEAKGATGSLVQVFVELLTLEPPLQL